MPKDPKSRGGRGKRKHPKPRKKPMPKSGVIVYVATLEMACDYADPTTPVPPPEFYADGRWTMARATAWKHIVIGPTPTGMTDKEHVASTLNDLISCECLAQYKLDVKPRFASQLVAFSPETWSSGGGGLHRGVGTVATPLSEGAIPWTFPAVGVPPGNRHTISIVAEWRPEVVHG